MLSRRDTVSEQKRPLHAVLVWLSPFVLFTCSSLAQALGLGELRVQSALGQPLRLSVPVMGHEADNVLQVCVKAKVLALDGSFLMALRVSVNPDPRAPALMLTSTQLLAEPAVSVLVEVICEANISRQYQILLDPPETALATAAKIVVPAVGANAAAAGNNLATGNTANAGNTVNTGNTANNNANGADGVTSRAEAKAARKAARAAARAAAVAAALEKKQARDNLAAAETGALPAPSTPSAPEKAASAKSAAKEAPASLKAASRLSTPAGPARNVLKVTGESNATQDIAGNALPTAGAKPALPLPDGPNLKLLLTRRLASDTSPISKAQVQVFSETVRQEQNSAVLIEVGRAEVRTLQKQIEQLEAELKQARSAAAASTAASSTALAANAAASGTAVAARLAAPGVAAVPASPAGAGVSQPEPAPASHTRNWVIGLAALLLVCLVAIAWLLWRLIQLRSRQVSFSASLLPEPRVEPVAAVPDKAATVSAPSMLASIFAKAAQSSASAVAESRSKQESRASSGTSSGAAHEAGPYGSKPASARAPLAKSPIHSPPPAKPESPPRGPAPTVALPSLDGPPELYKAERVAQADEPLEFTFPDELELQTDAQAESLQGLHRNSIDYATETEIPTVEEFTDVMYEAEFWISLGKLDKAIAVLEQYTSFENVSSPLPWLFLFDMYRKTDGHDQYSALQRQFQRMFNGKIPDWDDYDAEHQNMGLECMAGLMARVEAFWMTDEIVPFLENLLVDDRDGTRQGFELGVYRDILFLTEIAREVQKSSEYEKLSSVFKLAPLE